LAAAIACRDSDLRIGQRNPAKRRARRAFEGRGNDVLHGQRGRDVPWPTFGGVEANLADRVLVLPLKHVHDDGSEVGAFNIGFRVGAPVAAEVIDDDVDVLIIAIRLVGNDWMNPRFKKIGDDAANPNVKKPL